MSISEIAPVSSIKTKPFTVAIIGGGPGGLMAAYRLQQRSPRPCQLVLFESSPRLGGKVVTRQFATAPNLKYEAGAAEFYDYSQLGPDPLRELIAELGLATAPMAGGTVLFRGHLIRHLEDIRRTFGQDAWQALHHFEQQARALIGRQDYYESDWRKDNEDPLARQRFADLIDTIPNEAAREYIRIVSHSDLACEPHQTSASYGLQNYLMDEPDYMQLYTIQGGNERLVQALAGRISAEIRLEHRVTQVERGTSNNYRVAWSHQGQSHSEQFDFVIVALPNDYIPAISWGGEKLGQAMAAHHRFYDYPAHYLRVTVLFDQPFWRAHLKGAFFMSDAFGGCCVYDEGASIPAEAQGVLGWLLAGEAALRLGNLDDATLIAQVVSSLPAHFKPSAAKILEARVQRWAGSVNGLPAGYPARDPDSRHQPEPINHPDLFVIGDYLFDSTINGVLDSADTVVEWIIEESVPDEVSLVSKNDLGSNLAP